MGGGGRGTAEERHHHVTITRHSGRSRESASPNSRIRRNTIGFLKKSELHYEILKSDRAQ